ncbi:MAG: type II toxin-antitoxin system HicB family antitoxin [Nanoarchaeota archaeon]
MEFNVVIEKDEEGLYVASVPDIPGCYTQGKTLNQVLERIKEAIEVCLEADGNEIKPMKFIGLQKVEVTN